MDANEGNTGRAQAPVGICTPGPDHTDGAGPDHTDGAGPACAVVAQQQVGRSTPASKAGADHATTSTQPLTKQIARVLGEVKGARAEVIKLQGLLRKTTRDFNKQFEVQSAMARPCARAGTHADIHTLTTHACTCRHTRRHTHFNNARVHEWYTIVQARGGHH